ncbi:MULTISPECIES: membrane protein insertase YidC [Pseudidiomarina]|uniref:Membrane protein insertase YidC n=2 Tax=Pseudidiomarina TaxID=2800384 RepID=A0A368UYI3_9GAMM|nr:MULTISPECIES: membrane protein insertase YidC [Pseudidiomarina]PWW13737.1 protein translocase subunit yidC [Pseudidiomarina maritima]RBP91131.1 protein translocase subunit yidC [Pseudidiomarina tainanensis]RCW33145.1 protein translocase subunit yidC [Pseudidiomarina tainanensis]
MNSPRSILFIAFLVVSFFLYQNWLIDTAPGTEKIAGTEQTQSLDSGIPEARTDTGVTSSSVPNATNADMPATANAQRSQWVTVKTDVLDIRIDTLGGDVVNAQLLKFARTQDSTERFELLHAEANNLYIAQSGLVGTDGTDSAAGRPTFHVEQTSFEMQGDELRVPLHLTLEDGSSLTKTFVFTAGSYAVDVIYSIRNAGTEHKQMQYYAQLKQVITEGSGNMMMPTYRGGAYSWDEDRYEKYAFDDMRDQRLNRSTEKGWIAMLEHYFVSAWIPRVEGTKTLFSRVIGGDQAIMGMMYPTTVVAPGATAEIKSTLFMGPKDQDAMELVAEDLNLTVDYGFLWWLAQPIFKLLQFLQSFLINWGLSIIAVTVVIKLVLYPLTKAQYVSMAKMRMIQPKMQALRERYGDDRQKMSQAMMKMYKEEKVNPLGGCLPMLLQLPIFLALYWVLLESVELRHAPLFLWISDLSAKDPFFILPILMGASMFFMQRLQPTPATDPMQQKLLQFMPLIFTVFFLWFPSGLVLYWLSSNLITIGQMQWIYRGLEKKGMMERKKKK